MQPLPWQVQSTKQHRSVLFFKPKGSPNPFALLSFDGSHITTRAAAECIRESAKLSTGTRLELTNARNEKALPCDDTRLSTYTYLFYAISREPIDVPAEPAKPTVIERLIADGAPLPENPEIIRIASWQSCVGNGVLHESVRTRVLAAREKGILEHTQCGGCEMDYLRPMRLKCCASMMCGICLEFLSWKVDNCPFCHSEVKNLMEGAETVPEEEAPGRHGVSAALFAELQRIARESKSGNAAEGGVETASLGSLTDD